MKYNPAIHHRKSIRLKGYDYSQQGLYFITICVQKMECLFGQVINGEMILNDAGTMINNEWLELTTRFPNTVLHEYVVMPNHFHGILEITAASSVRAPLVGARDTLITRESISSNDNADIDGAQLQPEMQGDAIQNNPIQGDPIQGVPIQGNHEGLPLRLPAKKTVGDMMDAFKSITTGEYIKGVKNLGWPPFNRKLWQRNYYEHIIRNHESYLRIANYIINNPANWQQDKFYPP